MNNSGIFPSINLIDFDYELPKDKIALYPAEERTNSRLLYTDIITGEINHYKFEDILNLIPKNSHLVLNTTKVIAARLKMRKNTGGKCEILLISPILPSTEPATVMNSHESTTWNCIIGGRKIKNGDCLYPEKDNFKFIAIVKNKNQNYANVEFIWDKSVSFAELIDFHGEIPLPPYINRDTEKSDEIRYQTVYAADAGSVAAPTAGLHFTNYILDSLNKNGIDISELTLHVGPGTFLPISNDTVENHVMHDEMIIINKSTILTIINNLKKYNNIIAVGTTSVRSLESLYWVGLKYILNKEKSPDNFLLEQEDSYILSKLSPDYSALEVFNALFEYLDGNNLSNLYGRTKLFILPGYNFKIVNGIITNFHLPKSTLILLVAAFTGKDLWRKVYNEALEKNYRFLSYGDSSFLFYQR